MGSSLSVSVCVRLSLHPDSAHVETPLYHHLLNHSSEKLWWAQDIKTRLIDECNVCVVGCCFYVVEILNLTI